SALDAPPFAGFGDDAGGLFRGIPQTLAASGVTGIGPLRPPATDTAAYDARLNMALGLNSLRTQNRRLANDIYSPEPARNDAFCFWKLPEQWREPLGSAIAGSQPLAECYLLEGYLNEEQRRPPAALGSYYRIK